MFTDENGNEFQVLQMLHDALMLERADLLEKMDSFEDTNIAAYIGAIVQSHTKQMDHLMRAVGNLESRLMALQRAAGIEVVAYPAVDIFHVNPDDD